MNKEQLIAFLQNIDIDPKTKIVFGQKEGFYDIINARVGFVDGGYETDSSGKQCVFLSSY